MQVKKFEAPTIQEALEVIKRELGPEAIILQTKKNKRGFGLMSKASVEVTAAVSERSMHKKSYAESKLPEAAREQLQRMPAQKQAKIHDNYLEQHLAQAMESAKERVELSGARRPVAPPAKAQPQPQIAQPKRIPTRTAPGPAPKVQATRYIDIQDAPSGAVSGKIGPTGMPIEDEVKHLKRMVEEMRTAQEDSALPTGATSGESLFATPALQDAYEQLIINGIEKRYAFGILKKVAFELGEDRARNPEDVLDQIASEILETTEISSPLSGVNASEAGRQGPVVLVLVGPTGVGKTTTVAKIASDALLKRGLKVGLVNLDSYKVAAFDQLGTYAKILNVPFRSASTGSDLEAAIQDFHTLDLVLVDTTGRSHRDAASLQETHQMLQSIPGVRTQLVLSATTRDSELYDISTRFGVFKPQGLIISKLDEASIYGSIYNVSQRAKLPLLYFTTGQRVPEDIEEATQERLVSLLMDL
ncbi:MAG: flagellar biosynthesis protein FlhF [Bdellovibrionota bacterium]